MALERFRIVSPKDGQSVDNVFETLLINLDGNVSNLMTKYCSHGISVPYTVS